MKIRYTLPALADVENILSYIEQHSRPGARRVMRQIRATENLLKLFPAAGRQTSNVAIRRIKVSRFPYLIFYAFDGAEIIVHAVRHGARDPSRMPDA